MRSPIGMMSARCLLLASTLAIAGCRPAVDEGQPEVAAGKRALLETGELYRLSTVSAKKPPAKLQDLRGGQTIGPAGYQAVQDGSIVVVYSARLNDTSEEGSTDSADEVLAYAKEVPEKGGLVLLKNRTVKSVTAEQFRSMPKAGK